jgi:hypothetical protein
VLAAAIELNVTNPADVYLSASVLPPLTIRDTRCFIDTANDDDDDDRRGGCVLSSLLLREGDADNNSSLIRSFVISARSLSDLQTRHVNEMLELNRGLG